VRRWLPFLVPFLVVFGAGSLYYTLTETELFQSDCTYEDVELDELGLHHRCVRVDGMAHYTAVVKQQAPATLFRPAATWYLFAFFPPYDTSSRAIRVLARSTQEPEDLVSYELMRVEGRVERVTPERVPYETEVILGEQSEYFFSDDMLLLVVDHVLPFDDGGDDAG